MEEFLGIRKEKQLLHRAVSGYLPWCILRVCLYTIFYTLQEPDSQELRTLEIGYSLLIGYS
jgi:hypothetical protein